MDTRHVVIGAVCSLFVATWIFTAPVVGLPFGIGASAGDSMGDDGLTINVWADIEPSVGDVVIYETGGELANDWAHHRIVEETNDGFVTQGDGNSYTDQEVGVAPVTDEQTAGVVLYRVSVWNAIAGWSVLAVATGSALIRIR